MALAAQTTTRRPTNLKVPTLPQLVRAGRAVSARRSTLPIIAGMTYTANNGVIGWTNREAWYLLDSGDDCVTPDAWQTVEQYDNLAAGRRWPVAGLSADDCPLAPDVASAAVITGLAPYDRTGLSWAASAVVPPRDDSRPALNALALDIGPSGMFAIAADGFRLHAADLDGRADEATTLLLPPSATSAILALLKLGLDLRVSATRDTGHAVIDAYTAIQGPYRRLARVITRTIDSRYPDWRNIVRPADRDTESVLVTVGDVRAAARDTVTRWQSDCRLAKTVSSAPTPPDVPMHELATLSSAVTVNAHYLLDALSRYADDQHVTIGGHAELSTLTRDTVYGPVVIRPADGGATSTVAVIMPMHLPTRREHGETWPA